MEWADVGERVRESRLAAGMSQDALGHRVGLDRTMIGKIESGRRHVDALELVRLSRALQVPIGHFLYRPPQVVSRRAALVEDTDTDAARRSYRMEAALLAWLRDIRQLVELDVLRLNPVVTYDDKVEDAETARHAARWARGRLGLEFRPIDSLMRVCEQFGQLLLVTDLPGEGASLVDGDLAVAIISRQSDPGRRRSTAAHELGHLVLGDEYTTDLGVSTSRADREKVVDAFAAELLLPADAIRNETNGADLRDRLVRLAATYRTSWSLTVRQAYQAGVIVSGDVSRLSAVTPTRAEFQDAVGWAPQPDLESVLVPPSYAHAVIRAWKDDFITSARAVELMYGQLTLGDLPAKPDLDEP